MDTLKTILNYLETITDLASKGLVGLIVIILLILVGVLILFFKQNISAVWKFSAFVLFLFTSIGGVAFIHHSQNGYVKADCGKGDLTIGGKSFLESSILLEIMASVIEENHKDIRVHRVHNFGETSYIMNAIRDCDIDIYADYTGTILAQHLKTNYADIRNRKLHNIDYLNSLFQASEKFNKIEILNRFGFNNSYALTTTKSVLENLGFESKYQKVTITEFSKRTINRPVKFKSTYEFYTRPDGLRGLKEEYEIRVIEGDALQHGKKYTKLKNGEMELTDGYTTDYELYNDSDLVYLIDDREFFPLYYAVPLVIKTVLKNHPRLRATFSNLHNKFTEKEISLLLKSCFEQMITVEGLSSYGSERIKLRSIVHELLVKKGLI